MSANLRIVIVAIFCVFAVVLANPGYEGCREKRSPTRTFHNVEERSPNDFAQNLAYQAKRSPRRGAWAPLHHLKERSPAGDAKRSPRNQAYTPLHHLAERSRNGK